MIRQLNAEYIFSSPIPNGVVTVNVIIDYDREKYSITEPCQEGIFWGDRYDIVEDIVKAKLIHEEVMPFIAKELNIITDDEQKDSRRE